jgi:Mn-dependent DtxR family transcriptional regulator
MSVAQIFEELPKFNREELREIAIRAMKLSWDEAEREAMEIADVCARESAHRMEAMDADLTGAAV